MKEILKRKIERFSFDDLVATIGCVFLSVLVYLFFALVTADREVRCYYLSSYGTQAGIAYRIHADVDWKDDHVAFTSPDYRVTVSVLKELKQCGGGE